MKSETEQQHTSEANHSPECKCLQCAARRTLSSNESLIAELRFAGGVKSIDPVTRDLLRRARAALEGQNAHETRVSSQYRALAEEFIASNDLGEPRRNATRFFADWLDWRNTQKASGETPEGRTCLGCGRSYPCPSDCPAGTASATGIQDIRALLIGELQAGTAVNDDGITYIFLGPITDDTESGISIDHIEAAALHEWLGKALRRSLKAGDAP